MSSPGPVQHSFFDQNPSDLLKEHRLYYLLVNAISKRVRQLQLGDRALALPPNGNREALYIATQEFLEDKLEVLPRKTGLFEADALVSDTDTGSEE